MPQTLWLQSRKFHRFQKLSKALQPMCCVDLHPATAHPFARKMLEKLATVGHFARLRHFSSEKEACSSLQSSKKTIIYKTFETKHANPKEAPWKFTVTSMQQLSSMPDSEWVSSWHRPCQSWMSQIDNDARFPAPLVPWGPLVHTSRKPGKAWDELRVVAHKRLWQPTKQLQKDRCPLMHVKYTPISNQIYLLIESTN